MTVKTMGYLMDGMGPTELEALAKEARKRAYNELDDQLHNLESPFYHWCATGSGDFDLYHHASKEPKAVAWRSRREELIRRRDALREPPLGPCFQYVPTIVEYNGVWIGVVALLALELVAWAVEHFIFHWL